MKNIQRNNYLTKIKPFIDTSLIKVLTGQRRVGKSYLLLQIMNYVKKEFPGAKIIYINKESDEFDKIKNSEDLNSYIKKLSEKAKTFVFIDEIQEIENFEICLRSLLTKGNYDIYCTGSNASLLSGELASRIAGRYIEFRVHSLTYPEYLTFKSEKHSDKNFRNYIQFGGLPYRLQLPEQNEIISEYLQNIITTIFYKDIVTRHNIRNNRLLENLIRFLSVNTGSITSALSISKYLKSQMQSSSVKQILEYIGFAEQAFLIDRVKRIDSDGKKIFDINDKYYFEDIGLKNSLSSFSEINIPGILENVVYHHLKVAGYKIYTGAVQNREVDFIVEKNDVKKYIQVAYHISEQETIKREYGNLLSIKDNYEKHVLTYDKPVAREYSGIRLYSIVDYILDEKKINE
jgi:uncharacterized protein